MKSLFFAVATLLTCSKYDVRTELLQFDLLGKWWNLLLRQNLDAHT